MIDLHCHVLPGLDDGPQTLGESLAMCRMAAADGIRVVVAMPHTLNGVYCNEGEAVREAVAELQEAVRGEGLSLEILPGSDVHVDPAVKAMIRDGRVMTINDTGRAVMLEFPDYFVREAMCRFLESLIKEGIVPVISHPERCSQFRDDGLLKEMVRMGAVVQITAMSLTGRFGPGIQAIARSFLERGLVHVMATDAHSANHRPPVLSEAVASASRILGEEASRLVTDNPRALVEGRRPASSNPMHHALCASSGG